MLLGCDQRPQPVPVSGTVLIDGKPVPKGSLRFLNRTGKSASGSIDSQGNFTLTTYKPNDGCFVGEHTVEVIAFEPVGPSSQRWLVPKEYNNASTTDVVVNIDGPKTDLKIELTWKKSTSGKTGPYVDGNNAKE